MRIQDIADLEGLTPEYVAKLMRILRNGALVTSTRGAAGGYQLGRPADEITLWDAVDVLGGPLFPDSFCDTHPGALRDCVHTPGCSIRSVWRELNALLRTALASVTIEDLKAGERSSMAWLAGVARGDELTAGGTVDPPKPGGRGGQE